MKEPVTERASEKGVHQEKDIRGEMVLLRGIYSPWNSVFYIL